MGVLCLPAARARAAARSARALGAHFLAAALAVAGFRRDDHLLSTLRKYIEALGGDLEVVVVFNDKRVRLRGV